MVRYLNVLFGAALLVTPFRVRCRYGRDPRGRHHLWNLSDPAPELPARADPPALRHMAALDCLTPTPAKKRLHGALSAKLC